MGKMSALVFILALFVGGPEHGCRKPTCGYYGGTYCSAVRGCPAGYSVLPPSSDCVTCCR